MGLAAIGQGDLADQTGRQINIQRRDHRLPLAVPGQRPAVRIAGEQTVLRAVGIRHHQPGRIAVAGQVVQIDFVRLE